jgi:hypothetical protein
LGNPAAVRGLKYDQESDTFTARCFYKLFQNNESNKVEEIEEIMAVSEEWLKLVGFANGVVEHVISMDSGCGFVPVPEGVEILMNTRKVQRVKYVQRTARWVLDLEAIRAKAQQLVEEEKREMLKRIAIETGKQIDQELVFPSERRQKCTQEKIEKDCRRKEINNMPMKEVISGGYWQVIFQDNSRPMQTDETFVKANFPDAYISELMRMKKVLLAFLLVTSKFLTYLNISVFMFMALLEFVFHRQMGKTYVFLSPWLWLFIRLVSKKRHSVLKRTELQTCRVVLLMPLARSFAWQRPCFQRGY